MTARQLPPLVGPPTPVRFPAIARDELSSGLRIWSLPWHAVPVVTVALLIERGAAGDPATAPGLSALTAHLVDQGAGGRDAVALSDAFARLGAHLEIDVSQDTSGLSLTTLSRNLDPALALLADVVIRPHLAEPDFQRARELRLSRLRQMRTSASAAADRAFLAGVFGSHAYGHGTLGTTRAIEAVTLNDARALHAEMFLPDGATLVVAGDVSPHDAAAAVRRHFQSWIGDVRARRPQVALTPAPAQWLLVDRPGAPQSELRVGLLGPSRQSPAYHALVTLNAAIGGQFTSRINHQLREAKGYTYGARTGFDFRRACSTFACDTSVQSNATAEAIGDILSEFAAVGSTRPVAGEELVRARNALTRGYVRHFETAGHLTRAALELAKFDLPDDAFDRFVPTVGATTEADLLDAARRFLDADACIAVIVGDGDTCRSQMTRAGRTVQDVTPEF